MEAGSDALARVPVRGVTGVGEWGRKRGRAHTYNTHDMELEKERGVVAAGQKRRSLQLGTLRGASP